MGDDAPILVVDDSRVSQHLAGRLIQNGTGRAVVYANNGSQALALIKEVDPLLVLTDLQMPGMNGLELVGAIRRDHPRIPVILMTAYGSEEAAMQALKAGAANYVPKKYLITELVDTIRSILEIVAGDRRRQQVLSFQTSRARSFEIQNDPNLLTPLIDLIREDIDSFAIGDETARIRVAVALRESLANALYHGNLECSTDLRQEDERIFHDLADRRRASEPYRSRRVHVESRIGRNEARFVIGDEGPGFDVASLDKPFNPEDLMRVGGRGMILIRTFMDEVFHNQAGNRITLVKRQ
jgi:CheY-like chemotaxis protein